MADPSPLNVSPAPFAGLPPAAFDLFHIPSFAERMSALRQHATPALEALGRDLVPAMTQRYGEPAYAHVARHLRRRVSPPDDTWVAWSASARGYKSEVHFEAGVRADGAFLRLTALPEAGDLKTAWLDALTPRKLAALTQGPLPVSFTPDHHGEEEIPIRELHPVWAEMVRRARRRQAGCGLVVAMGRRDVAARGPAFADDVLRAVDQLLPLWRSAGKIRA